MNPMNLPASIPLPFCLFPWRGKRLEAAKTLWSWHEYLRYDLFVGQPGLRHAQLEEDANRILSGQEPRVVSRERWRELKALAMDWDLPLSDLAEQVRAAGVFSGPVRFDSFIDLHDWMESWVYPHARLLAKLAGITHRWQLAAYYPLAEAFFLTRVLVSLPADLARDHLFIPGSMLDAAGVDLPTLKRGIKTDAMGDLLWKWSIRTRDGYGRSRELIAETPLFRSGELRRWALLFYWHGGIQVLRTVEKNGFDVWTKPPEPTIFSRYFLYLQTVMGRVKRRL